ncbi:hypothetical protein ZWY2020_030903 [Hordeum vulgare]|nr:hypothetical protein ZWY2020_030903 [Hordeum vulgare]
MGEERKGKGKGGKGRGRCSEGSAGPGGSFEAGRPDPLPAPPNGAAQGDAPPRTGPGEHGIDGAGARDGALARRDARRSRHGGMGRDVCGMARTTGPVAAAGANHCEVAGDVFSRETGSLATDRSTTGWQGGPGLLCACSGGQIAAGLQYGGVAAGSPGSACGRLSRARCFRCSSLRMLTVPADVSSYRLHGVTAHLGDREVRFFLSFRFQSPSLRLL